MVVPHAVPGAVVGLIHFLAGWRKSCLLNQVFSLFTVIVRLHDSTCVNFLLVSIKFVHMCV